MTKSISVLVCLMIPQFIYSQLSESRLIADDGEEFEYFGWSTALFGDYAIIGASEDDDNGPASGSAYIFNRSGRRWVQHQKLLPSDGSSYDTFGNAVAISDSYAVVGAQLDDDRGLDAGALYVFRRDGDIWTELTKLTASDGADFDHFGSSVSMSCSLIVAGASLDDDNGENSGSAYVFRLGSTGWTEEAKLLANDGNIDDRFEEVGISDSTIIVGAWGDQDQGDLTGSAYIFVGTGGVWTQQAKLIASDQAGGDQFGIDVAISGDRAIVGAWANDDGGENSGSAYVFQRSGVLWVQELKLLPDDGAEFDEFGLSVSIHGDFALVGSDVDDDNGENSGSAYLFRRDDGGWNQVSKIIGSDGAPFDYFGISVAIDDLNAIIGAGGDDDNGSDAGAAYVYEGFSVPPEMVTLITPEHGAVIGTDTVLLIWNQAFPGVDRYWIEWSNDSLFVPSQEDTTVTDTTFFIAGLQGGQAYWWRVRAHNLAGWGPFSNPWTFSVVLTDVVHEEPLPLDYSLSQNYPNPFNPNSLIRYSLPVDSHVSLKIYDLLGREVASLVSTDQAAGYHQITLDGSQLSTGVYLYSLTAGSFRVVKKMVVIK